MNHEMKKRLRAAVRQAGEAVGKHERADMSKDIVRRIEESPKFKDAAVVALYHSLPDEVFTDELIQRWRGRKKLALPSIGFGWMIFREYTGDVDMVSGRFGIREPSKGRIVPPEQIDIMIVPGMAFDGNGRRLGRGKGYYDSYLSSRYAGNIHKVGVCFPHQLVDSVPSEPHDIVMDEVVSVELN